MTTAEKPDPLLRMLADLPPVVPTDARDRRMRARCHAAMARREGRRAPLGRARTALARMIDAALAVGISLYGAAAVVEAVRLVVAQ